MSAVVKSYKRKRTGLLVEKIGMTMLYDKDGKRVAVTVLQLHQTMVTAVKTPDNCGYTAVQIATINGKTKHMAKPQIVELSKIDVPLLRYRKEFRVSQDALLQIGDRLSVAHFVEGQYVDVCAKTIGKGFAGVMKRHNFRGLEASHGVSITHRSHGSTGQRQDPGRVFKNKKMAGHLGDVVVTVQNLQIVKIDETRQIIYVKGAVPGAKGAFVQITDAVKRAVLPHAPYPAALFAATPENIETGMVETAENAQIESNNNL